MNRFVYVACVFTSFLLISPNVKSEPIAFDFEFDAPSFTKPELSPLNQIFLDNNITQVNGIVGWDTDDADTVTSDFTLMSNIDGIFDSVPDELVFAPSGNLNQIRSWEIEIGGTPYILELTGLDPTDDRPNQWFGGQITSPESPNTFDLTDAGGGLTPRTIAEPSTLTLFGMALVAVFYMTGYRRDRRYPMSARGLRSRRTSQGFRELSPFLQAGGLLRETALRRYAATPLNWNI